MSREQVQELSPMESIEIVPAVPEMYGWKVTKHDQLILKLALRGDTVCQGHMSRWPTWRRSLAHLVRTAERAAWNWPGRSSR